MRTNLKHPMFLFICAIVGLLWINMIPVYAAGSVTVSADKNSVQLNDSITVSVKTSEPEDPSTPPQLTVTYDPQLLTFQSCDVDFGGGEGGLLTITSTSANITFTAAKTGSTNISVEAVIDEDGNNPAKGDASIQIGTAEDGKSADATLRALSVNPGNMEPAFSPDVTDYTITIDNSVTDITVSGGVSDENAQITAASGFKNLKAGDNQAVITITAADGSTLTYHFKIIRGEAEQKEKPDEAETENDSTAEDTQTTPTSVATLGTDGYTISSTFDNSLLPQGFKKISFSYKGQSIDAASFEAGSIIVLYGVSSDGDGKFYIYDEGADSLTNFVQIKGNEGHFIIPLTLNEKLPSQFKEEQLQWDDFYLPAGKLKNKSISNADAFYLLYAVNNDGNSGFYLYDVQEGTYQRFIEYGSTGAGIFANIGKKDIIIIGVLIFLLVCSLMAILNLILRNRELAEDYGNEKPEMKSSKKESVRKAPAKKVSKENESAEGKPISKSLKSEEQIAYELGLELDPDVDKDQSDSIKTEQKPKAKKVVTPENPVKQKKAAAPTKTSTQNQMTGAKKQPVKVKKEVTPQVKKEVTPQVKREVTPQGITYTTGQIPITVVQPAKTKTTKSQVPIYTLERKPVSLTREAGPDELDDDFEFEFINIDNE